MAYRSVNAPTLLTAPVEVVDPSTRVGRATIGLTGQANHQKRAALGGRATIGPAGHGASVKKVAISNGRCALGFIGWRTSSQVAAARGRAVLGLTTTTRSEAIGVALHAGPPVYPPAWSAGPPQ